MTGDWFGAFCPADGDPRQISVCVLSLAHGWSGRIEGTLSHPGGGAWQREPVLGWAFGKWFSLHTLTVPSIHYRGSAWPDHLVLGTWRAEDHEQRRGPTAVPPSAAMAAGVISDVQRSPEPPTWMPGIPPSIDPPPHYPKVPQDPDVVINGRASAQVG